MLKTSICGGDLMVVAGERWGNAGFFERNTVWQKV